MSKANGKPKKRRRRFGRCYPRPGGPRGAWLIQFPDPSRRKAKNGRTAYLTKSVSSKSEGERLLKEIEKAILAGRFALPQEEATCDITLLESVDQYIESKRGEGKSGNGIRRYLTSRAAIAQSKIAGCRVADLGPRDVEGFMAWRRQRR